jgi:hypothetical protein
LNKNERNNQQCSNNYTKNYNIHKFINQNAFLNFADS